MAVAYSYIRFSSEKQSKGDSLRRQKTGAEEYAAKHGLELNTSSYQDLGLSAYKGKNMLEGSFGTFLRAVESGVIPSGSFLLVESLDRISRQEVRKALPIFLQIINAGITIVTVGERDQAQVYSAEKIDQDMGMSLFASMMVLMRAHNESKEKGRRVKEAWDRKRLSGKPMTTMCPPWLQLAEDRSHYVIKQEKAAIVQRMFELSANGVGVQATVVKFNSASDPTKKVPMLGTATKWSAASVAKVLHNKAVIGTLVSDRTEIETPMYYPPIIDPDLFYRVQKGMELRNNQGKGRKGAMIANLFSGMCRCGDCGGAVRYVVKKPNAYLQCRNSYEKTGQCDAARLNYEAIENSVLAQIFVAFDIPLLPEPARTDASLAWKGELADKNTRMERYLNEFEGEDDKVLQRAVKLRMQKLGAEIAVLEENIASYVPPPPLKETLARAHELWLTHALLKGKESTELRDTRLQLQSALQPIIRRVALPTMMHKTKVQHATVIHRNAIVYGALTELTSKFERTPDGGLVIPYILPERGMLNSVREAEFARQEG